MTLRRLAPVVYAVILIALLFVSTAAFVAWLIVGAILLGLVYTASRPAGGRQRNRRRRGNL